MLYEFAALRFIEDENISDRVYWYLTAFPLVAGEQVLAPVGAHSRLQCARVERTMRALAENAPYDLRLIKSVVAKYGDRERTFGGTTFWELGGVRYDQKRFTQFHKILFTESNSIPASAEEELARYGVERALDTDGDVYDELIRLNGCTVLYGGSTRETVKTILAALRGQACPLSEQTILALGRKLK